MIKSSNNRNYLKKSRLYEQTINIIVALIIAFSIRIFVLPSMIIKSNSMSPILEGNDKTSDHVIVNKIKYLFDKPSYDNIIAFKNSKGEIDFAIVKGRPLDKIYSKKNDVFVNDVKLILNKKGIIFVGEDYLSWTSKKPFIVPEGHYLIIQLNGLINSNKVTYDIISNKEIEGKVIFIYWPINRIKRIIS